MFSCAGTGFNAYQRWWLSNSARLLPGFHEAVHALMHAGVIRLGRNARLTRLEGTHASTWGVVCLLVVTVAHVARDHVYPAISVCLPAACSDCSLQKRVCPMQRIVFSCAGTGFNGHGLHISATGYLSVPGCLLQ